jgi:hypothetical protein
MRDWVNPPICRSDRCDGVVRDRTVTRALPQRRHTVVIQAEEAPRDGVSTTAHWELIRHYDCKYHLQFEQPGPDRSGRGFERAGLRRHTPDGSRTNN